MTVATESMGSIEIRISDMPVCKNCRKVVQKGIFQGFKDATRDILNGT